MLTPMRSPTPGSFRSSGTTATAASATDRVAEPTGATSRDVLGPGRDWLVACDGDAALGWHALPPGSDPGPRPEGEERPLNEGVAACGHRDSFHYGDDASIFSALWRCAACCAATGVPPGSGRPHLTR